jgi:hypothetical protein
MSHVDATARNLPAATIAMMSSISQLLSVNLLLYEIPEHPEQGIRQGVEINMKLSICEREKVVRAYHIKVDLLSMSFLV